MFPQDRQSGAVHPLGAQHVDVVRLCKLLRRKSLGRTEHHVSRIVDHDVEAPGLDHDTLNRGNDFRLKAVGLRLRRGRAAVESSGVFEHFSEDVALLMHGFSSLVGVRGFEVDRFVADCAID